MFTAIKKKTMVFPSFAI